MNKQSTNSYQFYVKGMHCIACASLIEDQLSKYPGVNNAKVNMTNSTVDIDGIFIVTTKQEIAEILTERIIASGYTLLVDKPIQYNTYSDFKIAIPIAIAFILVFIILQKFGLVKLVNSENMSFSTAFIVGIIASLSSCMAVVGGLLLSISATSAKVGNKALPQIMFHLGRLISFFILGGLIGLLGSTFTLNTQITFIIGISVGLVMLVLGINLLDIFPWAHRLQPRIPKFINKYTYKMMNVSNSITPLIVGIATFFLPCGFTQSMQLYTLSTGSFWNGAMTMFIFALGTFPVLLLISSLSSFSVKNTTWSGIFFKTAGLIVILFAIFNILNSLVAIGIIRPIFNF